QPRIQPRDQIVDDDAPSLRQCLGLTRWWRLDDVQSAIERKPDHEISQRHRRKDARQRQRDNLIDHHRRRVLRRKEPLSPRCNRDRQQPERDQHRRRDECIGQGVNERNQQQTRQRSPRARCDSCVLQSAPGTERPDHALPDAGRSRRLRHSYSRAGTGAATTLLWPVWSTARSPNNTLSFEIGSVTSATSPTAFVCCQSAAVVSRHTTSYPTTSGSTFLSHRSVVSFVNFAVMIRTFLGVAGPRASEASATRLARATFAM